MATSFFAMCVGMHKTPSISNRATPALRRTTVASAAASSPLLDAAELFINSESGFYSPHVSDRYAHDFVFRGPIVGPLNKVDYLSTMDTFKIYNAFPDISPNAFGFTIDPLDARRVWFFVRNTGTNTGPFGLGFGIEAPASGNAVVGVPEAFSITFDDTDRVRHLTVGYVADRFEQGSNTGGQGAAFGLLGIVGVPLPGGLLYKAAAAIINRIPGISLTPPSYMFASRNRAPLTRQGVLQAGGAAQLVARGERGARSGRALSRSSRKVVGGDR